MKTILVPTDFSKQALNAAKYALAYAEQTNAKILLFHSYTNAATELRMPFSEVYYGKLEATQQASKEMNKFMATLARTYPTVEMRCILHPGVATGDIVDCAKQKKVALIIMGTTGNGAISRAIMGSTTSYVISNASCTVIAVPPKAKFKGIAKVAIATDLEQSELLGAKESIAFAKQFGAELTFVHVQDLAIIDAEEKLKTMIDKIKVEVGVKEIQFYVIRDLDVADGLDYFIKKHKPNILSMVTYSRKFPEIIWKTSWTNKMSNHIDIPLLILHVPKNKALTGAEESSSAWYDLI